MIFLLSFVFILLVVLCLIVEFVWIGFACLFELVGLYFDCLLGLGLVFALFGLVICCLVYGFDLLVGLVCRFIVLIGLP